MGSASCPTCSRECHAQVPQGAYSVQVRCDCGALTTILSDRPHVESERAVENESAQPTRGGKRRPLAVTLSGGAILLWGMAGVVWLGTEGGGPNAVLVFAVVSIVLRITAGGGILHGLDGARRLYAFGMPALALLPLPFAREAMLADPYEVAGLTALILVPYVALLLPLTTKAATDYFGSTLLAPVRGAVSRTLFHGARGRSVWDAARAGDLDSIRACIERGGELNRPDEKGIRPIVYAAGRGFGDIVQIFLENGVEVDSVSSDGTTALMAAAALGRSAVVSQLLEAGADPSLRRVDGQDAHSLAVFRRKTSTARLLTSADE